MNNDCTFRRFNHSRTAEAVNSAPFGLFLGYFQPLTTPDALHALVVHMPTPLSQQGGDAPISVTAILTGQIDNHSCQGIFVTAYHETAALRRSWLPKDATGATFRNAQVLLHMANRLSALVRA
jgi:hypothetical protein